MAEQRRPAPVAQPKDLQTDKPACLPANELRPTPHAPPGSWLLSDEEVLRPSSGRRLGRQCRTRAPGRLLR
jgi:hypothetical protein